MQTRRDQLHAYRFQMRRALAALVTGEPDVVEPPMRRLTVTTISGIMVAILVAAGFALVGLIKPGAGDKWREAGTVIVERETGARYVLLDDVLHPVLNYSSAVLALGGQQRAHVTLVGRSDLKHVKRGPAIGIDGIPDSLPSAGHLVRGPWTVCSRLQAGPAAELAAQVSLTVGQDVAAHATATGRAVPVTSTDGKQAYLLWQGLRMQVASADVATSLGIQGAAPLVVGTAFLGAVPQGAALRTPDIPHAGLVSAAVGAGHGVVGQLLHVTDNNGFFVVLDDGVAPVNEVQTALLRTLTVGTPQRHLAPVDISEDVALGLPQSRATWAAVAHQFDGLPQRIPQVDGSAEQSGGLCAVYPAGGTEPSFTVPPSRLPSFPGSTVTESDRSRQGQADLVTLTPGSAALVRAPNAATAFLVAEPGLKYATASADALNGFGYGGVQPGALPAQVLLLIPTGPALDPTSARRPASG